APPARALKADIEYLLLFSLAMPGLSGINDAPAPTSFTHVWWLSAAGMTVFYQPGTFTGMAAVEDAFFYHDRNYLSSL
ncbi:MAG: hypothetical protein ACXWT3_09760, partial [Methylococcaceae bacterium]